MVYENIIKLGRLDPVEAAKVDERVRIDPNHLYSIW